MKIKYFLALWGLCYGNDTAAPVTLVNQNPFERFLELAESLYSLEEELVSLEIEQFQSRPQPNTINYTNCRRTCENQWRSFRQFDMYGCFRRCSKNNPEEARLLDEWQTESNRLCGPFGCQSRQLHGMGEPQQTPNLEARIQQLKDHKNRWEQELNQLIAPNVRTFESQIQNPEANCDQFCQWRAINRLQIFRNEQRRSGNAVGNNPNLDARPQHMMGNFQFL
jgi:hypothetical protein